MTMMGQLLMQLQRSTAQKAMLAQQLPFPFGLPLPPPAQHDMAPITSESELSLLPVSSIIFLCHSDSF